LKQLTSPIHTLDIKICLFINATEEFFVKHGHWLDASMFAAHHLGCQPNMDALANILGVSQDRCVLSVQIVDDILARWGGLRPLIDICFAFDGNWPANPFGKNPATAVLRGDHRCMQSELLSVGLSPQWWNGSIKLSIACGSTRKLSTSATSCTGSVHLPYMCSFTRAC
jgi:hypothetical protein